MTLEVIYTYFECYQNNSCQIWAQSEQADTNVDLRPWMTLNLSIKFNLFEMSLDSFLLNLSG